MSDEDKAARAVHLKEQRFHDAAFSEGTRRELDRYYSVTESSRERYEHALASRCSGARVLEFGCGTAGYSVNMCNQGARVTAIDISTVAVGQSRRWVASKGVTDITFSTMNAERLAFRDSVFDIVCGTGILHHLSLAAAFTEIARVLKPDGLAVFLEPMGHNPVINLYRRFTPSLRTEDEHPLRVADFRVARHYFRNVDVAYFHLAVLAAVPFHRSGLFGPVRRVLDLVDHGLFSALPFMRRYAWISVLILSHPMRDAANRDAPPDATARK